LREILITEECLSFIEAQEERVTTKFYQLIEVLGELKVVHSNFIKKLQNTPFYELRIRAGKEVRIVIFTIDHLNFTECSKAICLNGFIKKSNRDYELAIRKAKAILKDYLEN
jgi:hypothetical protein